MPASWSKKKRLDASMEPSSVEDGNVSAAVCASLQLPGFNGAVLS